jgi:hypothetical protein
MGRGEERKSALHVYREHHEMLPVWFFVGTLLLFYGVVIFGVGIAEYHHPPHVMLAGFHATLWGGIILVAIGAVFTVCFRPGRRRR